MAQGLIDKLLGRNQQNLNLPVLQMGENGQYDPIRSAQVELAQTPLSLRDRLLGRELYKDVDTSTIGDDGQAALETQRVTSSRPGLLGDLAKGYNENYNQGFNVNNFGQNKGWAERIGEGLGTVGRFIDSPIGRGLIAGGLNSMLGYDNSLQEGLTAMVGRQNAQTKDKLYRNQLNAHGIDTTGIGGNIGDDTYKQLLQAMQLKDNSEYRNAMLRSMDENRKESIALRKEQAEQRRQERAEDRADRAAQRALTARGQDLNYSLGRERLAASNKQNKENAKAVESLNNLNAIKNQLDRFANSFDDVNNPYRYRIAGGVSQKLNTLSPAESNFNSQSSLLLNKIARDLGGEKGVLSDQDIARIKESMPTLSDTKAQKKAKMNAIYNLLDDRMQLYGAYAGNAGTESTEDNPLGLDL